MTNILPWIYTGQLCFCLNQRGKSVYNNWEKLSILIAVLKQQQQQQQQQKHDSLTFVELLSYSGFQEPMLVAYLVKKAI